MEFVDGRTLREVLGAGALPTRRLLDLSYQLADGLAKAHAAGIVHRDLKPENVMVTKDGALKILDFGLAKLLKEQPDQVTNAPTAQATQAGTVMGTVGYMSPEQASGRPLDYRTDQFSMGSILYEMATGKRAFQRGTHGRDPDGHHPRGHRARRAAQRLRAGAVPLDRRALPAEGSRGALRLDTRPGAGRPRACGSTCPRRTSRAWCPAPTAAAAARPKRRWLSAVLVAAGLAAAFAGGAAVGRRFARTTPPSFQQITFGSGTIQCGAIRSGRTDDRLQRLLGRQSPQALSEAPFEPRSAAPASCRARTCCRSPPRARWRSTSTAAGRILRCLRRNARARGADRRRASGRGGRTFRKRTGLRTAPTCWSFATSAARLGSSSRSARCSTRRPATSATRGCRAKGDASRSSTTRSPRTTPGPSRLLEPAGVKKTIYSALERGRRPRLVAAGDEIWFTATDTGANLSLYAVTPPADVRVARARARAASSSRTSRRTAACCSRAGEPARRHARSSARRHARTRPVLARLLLRRRHHRRRRRRSSSTRKAKPEARTTLSTSGSPTFAGRPARGRRRALAVGRTQWALAALSSPQPPLMLLPTGAGEPRRLESRGGVSPAQSAAWLPDSKSVLFAGNEPGTAEPGSSCRSIDGGKPARRHDRRGSTRPFPASRYRPTASPSRRSARTTRECCFRSMGGDGVGAIPADRGATGNSAALLGRRQVALRLEAGPARPRLPDRSRERPARALEGADAAGSLRRRAHLERRGHARRKVLRLHLQPPAVGSLRRRRPEVESRASLMSRDGQPFSTAYPTLESLRALGEMWNASAAMKHFGARLDFERVDRVRAVIDPVLRHPPRRPRHRRRERRRARRALRPRHRHRRLARPSRRALGHREPGDDASSGRRAATASSPRRASSAPG